MKAYARQPVAVILVAAACLFAATKLAAQQEPASQDAQSSGQPAPSAQPVPQSPAADQNPIPTGNQSPADSTKPVDQSAPDNAIAPTEQQANVQAATSQDTTSVMLNNRIGPNYVIGPEDVLAIDVFDVPELSRLSVEVSNDGNISVPLLGNVKAAGLTQQQLRDELAEKWGEKYLQHPQVMLTIQDFKSRPVSVVGAVAKPGEYYLTGRRTLVEVLAMAGGPANLGASAGKEVMVERPGGFEDVPAVDGLTQTAPDKVSVEMKKLLYGQDTDLNIEIKPFDIISVSRAGIVYVVGAVNRPGGYLLDNKDSVSVLEAVAMAQGVGANARTADARIVRRSSSGMQNEVPINLKRVLAGKAPDITLAANDILFVPNNTAKAIGKQGIASALGIVTGLVIYRGL
jgi:polysaccharide biosynthesis/export protein